jgi:hypothetical protein
MTTRANLTGLLFGCALLIAGSACEAQRTSSEEAVVTRALENLRSSDQARLNWGLHDLLESFDSGSLSARRHDGRAVLDSLLALGASHSEPSGQRLVLGLAAMINERAGPPPIIRGGDWASVYERLEGQTATRLHILRFMPRHPSRAEALTALGRMAILSQGSPDEFTWAMDLLVDFEPGGVAELVRLQGSGSVNNPRAQQALDLRLRSVRPSR